MDTLAQLPTQETQRLHLIPLNEGHAEPLQKLTNHKEITEIVHFLPTPFALKDAETLLAGKGDGKDRFVGVWLKNQPDMVAVIGTHIPETQDIEVGYWVHPEHHRKGIATEAVSAVIAMLQKHFPKRQIIAECRPENKPSWLLLEKLGFRDTLQAGHRPGRSKLALHPTASTTA